MTPSILIVDDEEKLRITLSRILSKAGFNVTAAASGEEALNLTQAGPFDLAFIDLMMPGMGGLALLAEFRAHYPEMPVLILTAHATLDSAIEAVRQGARDYLLKPADPQRIIERVGEILVEQLQPQRQREILSQIQNLVSELGQISDKETTPPVMPAIHDPARFLQRGPFVLDLQVHLLSMEGNHIPLSPTNFDYLVTLVRHAPNPVSYQVLVREAQGYDVSLFEAREMTRWRIHELRKAIEKDSKSPQYLITVRGIGYKLMV
ncbi:MAG: response regulator transcription factor [Anaerolineales bacterium]|nr:response regulator transcription factor [Anaerolineales bacterium]